jgi:hypothetical protein
VTTIAQLLAKYSDQPRRHWAARQHLMDVQSALGEERSEDVSALCEAVIDAAAKAGINPTHLAESLMLVRRTLPWLVHLA